MAGSKSERLRPVRGLVEPATVDGFRRVIENANEVYDLGYRLVGLVNLGPKQIGAVLLLMPSAPDHSGNLVDY